MSRFSDNPQIKIDRGLLPSSWYAECTIAVAEAPSASRVVELLEIGKTAARRAIEDAERPQCDEAARSDEGAERSLAFMGDRGEPTVITINIYNPTASGAQIAREIATALEMGRQRARTTVPL